jgi:protein-S-isoprenylcysteine O-methyltransferase Ste14
MTMLEYLIIGYFVGINLITYFIVSLPLDFVTYRREESTRKKNIRPDTKQNTLSIITYFCSLTIWGLFVMIPLEQVFQSNILYHPILSEFNFSCILLQLIGIFLILCGTIVAVAGRISRWNRAFSWGVPVVLETSGIYRYIRHPLYASYCYYFIGFLLTLQTPLLLFLLLGILGYYDISKYEEEILVKNFGKEYSTYQTKAKRYVPFFW